MPKGIQIGRSKAKKWKVSATTKKGKPITPPHLRKLAKSGTKSQRARAKRVLAAEKP